MDSINTALSGLHASASRIHTSAGNIANAQSTLGEQNGQTVNQPYVPQQVAQKSIMGGGVSTSLRDISPPSIPVFDADSSVADENGVVNTPNVDYTQEVTNQILASSTYRANLSVIKNADEMYQSLLDIQS